MSEREFIVYEAHNLGLRVNPGWHLVLRCTAIDHPDGSRALEHVYVVAIPPTMSEREFVVFEVHNLGIRVKPGWRLVLRCAAIDHPDGGRALEHVYVVAILPDPDEDDSR